MGRVKSAPYAVLRVEVGRNYDQGVGKLKIEDKYAQAIKQYTAKHRPENTICFSKRGDVQGGNVTSILLYLVGKKRRPLGSTIAVLLLMYDRKAANRFYGIVYEMMLVN